MSVNPEHIIGHLPISFWGCLPKPIGGSIYKCQLFGQEHKFRFTNLKYKFHTSDLYCCHCGIVATRLRLCRDSKTGWSTIHPYANSVLMTLDHIKPRRFGGSNANNLRIMCESCNKCRGSILDSQEYAAYTLSYIAKHHNVTEFTKALQQYLKNQTIPWTPELEGNYLVDSCVAV